MLRLAICFFYLVFGNCITCVVMPLLPAVLSCFACVVLRCVMLCSVVICRSRCVALCCVVLRCVALCYCVVSGCFVALGCVLSVALRCCVVLWKSFI